MEVNTTMGTSIDDVVECYKVVTEDMESLGLKGNPTVYAYPVGEWFAEEEPINGPGFEGGIWAFIYPSDARHLKEYVSNHPDPGKRSDARVFRAKARGVLHRNPRKDGRPYSIKVREILLEQEIELQKEAQKRD